MWPLRRLLSSTTSAVSSSPRAVPNLVHRYEELLKEGVLRPDASQLRCLGRLQGLLEELSVYGDKLRSFETACRQREAAMGKELPQVTRDVEREMQRGSSSSSSLLSRFFGTADSSAEEAASRRRAVEAAVHARLVELVGPPPTAPWAPRGVYLHGSVGSGKTLLLDMLFAAVAESEALPLRRRLHCNAALLELHSRMHQLEGAAAAATAERDVAKHAKVARIAQRRLARERMASTPDEFSRGIAASNAAVMLRAARSLLRGEPPGGLYFSSPPFVGPSLASSALLCFDELQTTDPFNVAALKALTEAALADGGTLVATSNRAPAQLSPHGLHEAMFEHFVDTLHSGCDVIELSSATDYRRRDWEQTTSNAHQRSAASGTFFYPLNDRSEELLEAAWGALPGTDSTAHLRVPVMFGRSLEVRRHRGGGAAWFAFDELCARPLGPSDYVALAARFHTVFISGVPAMSMRLRDKARRFITLVDEVYNQRGRLVCSAAVELDDLFTGVGPEAGEEPLVDLEGLQFERAGDEEAEHARLAERMAAGGLGGEEERFAFARAVSRLHEMQCDEGGGGMYWRLSEAAAEAVAGQQPVKRTFPL